MWVWLTIVSETSGYDDGVIVETLSWIQPYFYELVMNCKTFFLYAGPEGFNEIVAKRAASSRAQQGGTSSIICSTGKGCAVAWQHTALKQELKNAVRFYEKSLSLCRRRVCVDHVILRHFPWLFLHALSTITTAESTNQGMWRYINIL